MRIVSGVIMLVAIVLIALINNFYLTTLVLALIGGLAFYEARRLLDLPQACIVPAALAFIAAAISREALFCGALLLILVAGYLAYKRAPSLRPALIYLYPTLPILSLFGVYLSRGIFALFWLIIIVAACDSFAYFTGKFLGRTPLSPSSEGKTVEGTLGGILVGTLIGTGVGLFFYGFFVSLLCSFFICVFAIIGDLIESYFKRQAGLKDSGSLIPGHGGVLDRIDALIIASFVPVLFL